MVEDIDRRLVRCDSTGCHILVNLALAFLPPLGPKPALVSRCGQRRPQFENAVLSLDQLDLSTRLVEVKPPTNVGRERDGAPALHADIARLRWCVHLSKIAVMRFCSDAAMR